MSTSDRDDDAATEDECVEPEAPEERDADDAAEFDLQNELEAEFGRGSVAYVGGQYTTSDRELPKPDVDDNTADAHVPPFTHEMQVCIADLSKFVLRDRWGRVLAEFSPDEVKRTPRGHWVAETKLAVERIAAKLVQEGADATLIDKWKRLGTDVEEVRARAWLSSAERPRIDELFVEVEPIRPECKHYLKQLDPPTPSQMLQGYVQGVMFRYCTAKRNVSGAFFGLSNKAMRACSAREPFDEANDARLRKFDSDLIDKSRDRVELPLFNLLSRELGLSPAPAGAPSGGNGEQR